MHRKNIFQSVLVYIAPLIMGVPVLSIHPSLNKQSYQKNVYHEQDMSVLTKLIPLHGLAMLAQGWAFQYLSS